MAASDLERRVETLESVEAIKRLKHQYCAYCDDGYDADASPGSSSRTASGMVARISAATRAAMRSMPTSRGSPRRSSSPGTW